MNTVRYEPWSLFDRFNRELNTLMQNRPDTDSDDSNVVTSRWAPAVDIREDQDKFLLVADIPGVDPKNIDITMENNVLTIKGERRDETEDEQAGFKRVERMHGTFYRRFSLPDSADDGQISAKGDHEKPSHAGFRSMSKGLNSIPNSGLLCRPFVFI